MRLLMALLCLCLAGQDVLVVRRWIVAASGDKVGGFARQANGVNQYLQSASSINLSSTQTISISFWMYWNTFANNDALAGETSSNYNGNVGAFLIDPNSGANPGSFEFAVRGEEGWLVCYFSRPSAAAWHHYVLQWDMSSPTGTCQAYVDGSSVSTTKIQDTGDVTNMGNFTLNIFSRDGSSLFGAGRISEIAIWGSTLTSGNAASLAAFAAADTVSPGTLLYYWPIKGTSPEVATVGSVNLNVTGATAVAGPNP